MPRRNTHFLRSFVLMTSLSLSIAARTKQKTVVPRQIDHIYTPDHHAHHASLLRPHRSPIVPDHADPFSTYVCEAQFISSD